MICTEEEAKTKWCPFARYALHDAAVSANRFPEGGETKCFGLRCMAWVSCWEHKDQQADQPPPGPEWEKDGPVTGEGGFITKRQQWRRHIGFCGLVGRPE